MPHPSLPGWDRCLDSHETGFSMEEILSSPRATARRLHPCHDHPAVIGPRMHRAMHIVYAGGPESMRDISLSIRKHRVVHLRRHYAFEIVVRHYLHIHLLPILKLHRNRRDVMIAMRSAPMHASRLDRNATDHNVVDVAPRPGINQIGQSLIHLRRTLRRCRHIARSEDRPHGNKQKNEQRASSDLSHPQLQPDNPPERHDSTHPDARREARPASVGTRTVRNAMVSAKCHW